MSTEQKERNGAHPVSILISVCICSLYIHACSQPQEHPLVAQASALGKESVKMQSPGMCRLCCDAPSREQKEN